MSNSSLWFGIGLAAIILFGINTQRVQCEASGGRLMKTLSSTYECIQTKEK